MINNKLPENWCVKGTGDEVGVELFNNWNKLLKFNTEHFGFYNIYFYFIKNNKIDYDTFKPINYEEITFDEFKKYVLNKKDVLKKEKCINNNYDYLIKILKKYKIK